MKPEQLLLSDHQSTATALLHLHKLISHQERWVPATPTVPCPAPPLQWRYSSRVLTELSPRSADPSTTQMMVRLCRSSHQAPTGSVASDGQHSSVSVDLQEKKIPLLLRKGCSWVCVQSSVPPAHALDTHVIRAWSIADTTTIAISL